VRVTRRVGKKKAEQELTSNRGGKGREFLQKQTKWNKRGEDKGGKYQRSQRVKTED
jgi:predicted SprT family Zn-dependent metalloprotease